MLATAQIFDIPVTAGSIDEVLTMIDEWIAQDQRCYVCTLDVHALTESHGDPEVLRIYNRAAMVTPDGMPIVWLLHHRGFPAAHRICGPDLMPAAFRHSEDVGYRHFLYGSTGETLDSLQRRLRTQYPRARIVGSYAPPFRELSDVENAAVDRLINQADPDIVWVSLGAPKQDRWMAEHRPGLRAPVLIGVGGAFEMLAGKVRRAPIVVQRLGCEWAFRLVQEPGRLWRRYLASNSHFLAMIVAQQMHGQRPHSWAQHQESKRRSN